MEKLVISVLLVGCCKLPNLDSADAFLVGIIYDSRENPEESLSAVLRQLESDPCVQSSNVTFVYLSVSSTFNWTACQLIKPDTLALVAVGNCSFHDYLSLRTQSYLPVPLIRVELGPSCGCVAALTHGVFSSSSRYTWLPHLVTSALLLLETNHLVIVYSAEFAHLARVTSYHLSMSSVKNALVYLDQFLDPLLRHKMLVQVHDVNSTVPVLLTVSKAEAASVLSRHETQTLYWMIFTGDDVLNYSLSPSTYQFVIIPNYPAVPWTALLYSDRLTVLMKSILQLITTSVKNLPPSPAERNSSHNITTYSECTNTVQSPATQLTDYLSQHVFDDNGYLNVGSFDITTASAEGLQWTGQWNISAGLSTSRELTADFVHLPVVKNRTLIVGTEEASPFVFLDNGTWKGFCIDMLNEMAVRMKFKYKIRRSVDQLWGGLNRDDSWNGLVGMALRKEIDLAIGPLSVTADREKMVDFTKPYMESAAGLLMRKYEDTKVKLFRSFMPFSLSVWLSLAGIVIIVGIIFGVINKLNLAYSRPRERHGVDRWIDSVWDSMWVVFGSFMEQGAERYPLSSAGRVVLGLWWVFTILITASYTASLAAFLTFQTADVSINSIYDLASQSRVLPLVKNGTNLYTLFQKQDTPTNEIIYEMMLKAPLIHSNEDALKLAMNGDYAVLTDKEQLDLMQMKDCQNLQQGKEHFNQNGLGFFVQDGSALLEPLSINVIKLMEAGLIDKWRRKWWPPTDLCTADAGMTSVQSLTLDTTAGPFILYCASTLLAILLLLLERAFSTLWPVCRAMVTRQGPADTGLPS